MTQVFIGGDRSCGHRDSKVGRQGISGIGFRGVRPVSESNLHSTQEGWFVLRKLNVWVQFTHFKMEGMVSLTSLVQRHDWMCKIDLKDAYKSLRDDGRAPSEVSPISLETPIVPVCQPSFRPGVRTEDVYEVTEASSGVPQTVRSTSNNLPRRHLPLKSKSNRGAVGSKYHCVAPTDAGVRHQLGEVQFGPITRGGVLGFCNRSPSFKPISPSTKGVKNSTRMFEDVARGNCDSEGVGKSDWKPDALDSCHSPSSLTLSQTANAQNKRALE